MHLQVPTNILGLGFHSKTVMVIRLPSRYLTFHPSKFYAIIIVQRVDQI